MLPVQFCNYNLDYQQRLGFLKLVTWVAQGVRGGKEEVLRKIEYMYSPSAVDGTMSRKVGSAGRRSQRSLSATHPKGSFEPETLLRLDEIPSWQPGFTFQLLDRLVLWAEMLGLISANGRLSEWSKPLLVSIETPTNPQASFPNPFLLSPRDTAFFLVILIYHDQVLLHLISILSRLDSGTQIDSRRACVEVMAALGTTLDRATGGTNIQAVKARRSLRELLERLAGMEKISHRGALLYADERTSVLQQIASNKVRNHLAEYHAVCRFEQLTDLGLLVKESPEHKQKTPDDRCRARTTWTWYTTGSLKTFGKLINACAEDVETYLQTRWAESCLVDKNDLRVLDATRDQIEIARLLDAALPRATRQLGAIQVHTWVFIAALDAIEAGNALEFSTAYTLLDAMRKDSRYSTYLRQSGQETYLGRTASLIDGSMSDYVSRYPLELRS